MNKIYSLLALLLVLLPVTGPCIYNASEVYSEVTEENLEVTSETESDIASETESDITSEIESDIASETKSDITSETESDIASETESDIASETKSDITSETKSDITSETESDIASRYQPVDLSWYDRSDAPATYGEIKTSVGVRAFNESEIPGSVDDLVYQDSPAALAQNKHMGLYLGYDAPDTDPLDVPYDSIDANLDDQYGSLGDVEINDSGYWSTEEYDSKIYNDDESAFVNIVSQPDGSIQYNPYDTEFNVTIPYLFSETVDRYFNSEEDAIDVCGTDAELLYGAYSCMNTPNPITSANLLMWIDTDLSGTFDEEEGIIVEDLDQYTYTRPLNGAGFALAYNLLNISYDMSSLNFEARKKLSEEDTYMRLVLTSDMDYGLDDASISPAEGTYGEIEDYKLTTIESTDYGYISSTQPQMIPMGIDESQVDDDILVYEDIFYPELDKTFDLKITLSGGKDGLVEGETEGASFSDYSGVGEPIDFVWIGYPSSDNKVHCTIEFFEAGTEVPIEMPFSLITSDFDRDEGLTLDEVPSVNTSENDVQYLFDGSIVQYTDDTTVNESMGFDSGLDYGTANRQIFTFENSNSITQNLFLTSGMTRNTGLETQITFPLTGLERDAPNFEVDKTSTPVGDGSVDVVTGDTISYEIDAKTTIDSDVGVQITDPLDADLTYVADSAELLLNGTDVTADATVEYVAADNELEVTYDHDIVAGDEFVLNFDATVGDEVGPYTIENTATVSDAKDLVEFTTPTTEHNVKANSEVTIDKALVESIANGYIDVDEDLTYTISVTNPSTTTPATGIEIRDSLLEELPAYLSYDGSVIVEATNNSYTGSLSAGDFVLASVAPGETATITYVVHVDSIPDGVEEITNIATDGGLDPITECDATTTDDCSEVTLPADGYTVISKEVSGLGSNDLVDRDETLEYTVNVKNPGTKDANNVEVRDSMLENLDSLSWITFNDDIVVAPEDVVTTGDLIDGDFVIETVAAGEEVTITYSVTVTEQIPEDVASLDNIATDDGSEPTVDPDCDETTSDCGAIVESKVNPETLIDKAVEESNPNGAIDLDEDLTYKVNVTNPNTEVSSYDVAVRDSMLEDLPTNISYDGSVEVDGSTYSGDLTAGTFVLDEVKAESTVIISYTVHVDSLPSDFSSLTNIATDTGDKPEPDCITSDECGEVTLPVNGSTTITKEVDGLGDNEIVDSMETLTYTLTIDNASDYDAINVPVRDSMLENLDSLTWITFNDDVKVAPKLTETTGSLTDGTFVINKIEKGSSVTITYSITVGDEIPSDVDSLPNVATNNGKDPIIDPDCDSTVDSCGAIVDPDVNPSTIIEKSVEDENDNQLADNEENLTYTIAVTNTNLEVSSFDVPVRDSMLENMPSNLEWDQTVTVEGSESTGDLAKGDFVLTEIKPGETATITYTVHINELSDDEQIQNIATDNGAEPNIDTCTDNNNCVSVTIPAAESEVEAIIDDVQEVDSDVDTTTDESEESAKSIAMTGSKATLLTIVFAAISVLLLVLKTRMSSISK